VKQPTIFSYCLRCSEPITCTNQKPITLSQTIRIALFPGVEEYPELVGLTRIFEQQQIASEIQLKRGNFSANSLLHGAEDAAITPLENLPVHQTEGIVIAAIIERQNPAECLVVSPKARDEAMLFRLREQAIVYTRTMRQQAQMNDFRPDVQFLEQLDKKEEVWQLLETGRLDAAILPAYTLTLAGEKVQRLSLSVFSPSGICTGTGARCIGRTGMSGRYSNQKNTPGCA